MYLMEKEFVKLVFKEGIMSMNLLILQKCNISRTKIMRYFTVTA